VDKATPLNPQTRQRNAAAEHAPCVLCRAFLYRRYWWRLLAKQQHHHHHRMANSSGCSSRTPHCTLPDLTHPAHSTPANTTTTTGWEAGRAAWCSPRPRPRRKTAGKCRVLFHRPPSPPSLPPSISTQCESSIRASYRSLGRRNGLEAAPHFPPSLPLHRFTVSVTPGLVSSLQKGSSSGGVGQGPAGRPDVVTTKEEAEEVAAAYGKGLKDAESNLRHHLVTQKVCLSFPPSLPPSIPPSRNQDRLLFLSFNLP